MPNDAPINPIPNPAMIDDSIYQRRLYAAISKESKKVSKNRLFRIWSVVKVGVVTFSCLFAVFSFPSEFLPGQCPPRRLLRSYLPFLLSEIKGLSDKLNYNEKTCFTFLSVFLAIIANFFCLKAASFSLTLAKK